MSEYNMLNMGEQTLGKVEIAPEVIEIITAIAASEVEGVASMRGNFAAGMVEKLGIKNYGKGVRVEIEDDSIILDVYMSVKFGESIPTVAQNIQDNIRQTLVTMTGLETKEVNIHVVGVTFEKATATEEA